jgi:ABC-type multidrug transport system fused ATPase/permease subunit
MSVEKSLFHFIWRYSRRDQIRLLAVSFFLFPLLFLTLELPKRIINDAIGAKQPTSDLFFGEVTQVTYLLVLCAAFLVAVLLHGLLKMRINTMKGVLAERMLRRLRYQLIERAIWFPRPYFERTSQGELVSMITAETEPMGGLMGDAISQPVLQAGQMLTILTFLFMQNIWFGLAAAALIPLQAWLIPKLQKQINLLNKSRIHEVRQLASLIGENAVGAVALRRNGGWRYRLAVITEQLGVLYAIRYSIYRKKFFMKFINNFISQLTPFLFYSIGGILVLQGDVSLGALVAALAAYKDLSSPWKELLTYYNQTQDLGVRWQLLIDKFGFQGGLDTALITDPPSKLGRLSGDIVAKGVWVRDDEGSPVLENLNVTLPGGSRIAIAAEAENDRLALVDLLSREILPASGKVTIGGQDFSNVHQSVVSARVGVASSHPMLFRGSFRDNVMMPVRTAPQSDVIQNTATAQAILAGNSPDPISDNWLSPSLIGQQSEQDLRNWWLQVIKGMGSGTILFKRGLHQIFRPDDHPDLAQHLVALRPIVREELHRAGLVDAVNFFDAQSFNDTLPIFENMIFATARAPLTAELMARQDQFFRLLTELGLDRELLKLSCEIVDMLRSIFGRDGTDHPLFQRLGLDANAYTIAIGLVDRTRGGNQTPLNAHEMALLGVVPFRIKAMEIGDVFDDALKARIVSLRHTHGAALRASLGDAVALLSEQNFAVGLPVIENAMFGRILSSAGAKADAIRQLVTRILVDAGAEDGVIQLIYDEPVGLAGAGLPAVVAEPLSVSRAIIKRPDVLILDQPLKSYDAQTRALFQDNMRDLMPLTTMIYIDTKFDDPEKFDLHLELRDGRIVTQGPIAGGATDENDMSLDLRRKLRALQQCALFSGLDHRQLRLLAFGARWFYASAGETVFHKGATTEDGAYILISGDADLTLPRDDGGQARHIASVAVGQLVGELGLIRKEPRSLSMKAKSDITCLRIGEEVFLSIVQHDVATTFKLLQVVAGYVVR